MSLRQFEVKGKSVSVQGISEFDVGWRGLGLGVRVGVGPK